MGQEMAVERSEELETAEAVLARLQELRVGEVLKFNPALPKPIVDYLYLLLKDVDKGWRIEPGPQPQQGNWWARVKASLNAPCDFGGRLIPQTIAEIKRIR